MDINKYIGSKIREFRRKKFITQGELGEYLNTTSQTISRYETGILGTNQDVLYKLAEIFNVSINDFFPPTINNSSLNNITFDNAIPIDLPTDTVKIPVLGRIPAGMPFEAIENEYTVDYEEIPREWLKGNKKYFALIIDGDSMEPKYQDKDIGIFIKSSDCESGQDCCIRINGFDATFKRVKKQENGIMVIPLNENNSSGFSTTFYTNEEIANKPVEIVGIIKQIRRNM